MNRITALLLLILTGQSISEHLQTLSCPYENKNVSLMTKARVWCKRDAGDENCCTGFSFQQGTTDLEGGKIQVVDDGKSFTISVQELTQGDGVYWCGIMTDDRVIFKLAEDYFTNNPINFVWSILRWIIFLLLSVMTISIHVYSNKQGTTERGRRHRNTE